MAKIQYHINALGATHEGTIEIHDDELEGLEAQERRDAISEIVQVEVENRVSWGWDEVSQP